jgi:hypothetical protein
VFGAMSGAGLLIVANVVVRTLKKYIRDDKNEKD